MRWLPYLVPGFASVADRKNHNLLPVVVVQRNISPLPKFDHPFTIFGRQFLHRTTDFWVLAQGFHALPDGLNSALRSLFALWGQKLVEASYIPQGLRRPPQTWHLGMAARLPASSLASQASASSDVRCRPVL